MSYMRGRFYVWSDGESIHINDVVMPDELFDQLVAMRWAEMTAVEKQTARKAAVSNFGGNFGCEALCKAMGVRSAMDLLDEFAAELLEKIDKEEK